MIDDSPTPTRSPAETPAAPPAGPTAGSPDGSPAGSVAESVAESLAHDPYGTSGTLREAGPVHRITTPDGKSAWLVTRYADVQAALADPRLSLDKKNALPGGYRGFELPPALDANLLNMDPPDHTRLRRLAGRAFTARRVAGLRGNLERAAADLTEELAAGEEAELVEGFAVPFTVTVICELLGVPAGARSDFRRWTDGVLGASASREGMRAVIGEMYAFFVELIAAKRAEPADDLLSALVAARDGGEGGDGGAEGDGGVRGDDRLTENELTSLAFLLLFAGFENSANLISGALLAVLSDDRLRASLREDPASLPALVEEVSRHQSPALLGFRRFPVEDVEIGGVRIPAGETVLPCIASANRDPRRFAEPDLVDPARGDLTGQLSFGHGIHYCIGAPLARLEAETGIGALLARFPGMALAGPRAATWRPSLRVRGLDSLRVRLKS